MQKTKNFEKNIELLNTDFHRTLAKKLKRIRQNKKYDLILNKDPLDLNIMEIKSRKMLYENPKKELEEKVKYLSQNKSHHPVLFFYGMGNGLLYKALLQNKEHRKIVIFEKDLELLFIALNLNDFSEALQDERLILVLNKDMDYIKSCSIFSINELSMLFRSYFLDIHSNFYEGQKKDILRINSLNRNAIIENALRKGNDPGDALQGIRQFIHNLPKMLTHPSYDDLRKKRTHKVQTAIIVATGPSLDKQLPLLKKYHKKVSIFCLDASYAILAKKGIKPDYVLSLERVIKTSEFFDNDFKDFDKGILFILLALTHPKTIEFLERNKRTYMLTPRYLPLAWSLKLDEFGFGNGYSVAHMAHQVALALGHKNIILIGQDLAFAQNGNSHSKDYPRGLEKARKEISSQSTSEVRAYGGKGMVRTTIIWELFKKHFEMIIESTKNQCTTYNATEGGARIEGAIEKPFRECCEEFLTKDVKKPLPLPKPLLRERQNELMLKSYKKLKSYISLSDSLGKHCKRVSNQIKTITQNKGTRKLSLEEICKNIDAFKEKIHYGKYYFLSEILGPSTFHAESLVGPLYLKSVKNEEDRQNKLVAWIYANDAWIDEIYGLIYLQNGAIKKAIIPLREMLEKRKML